MARNVQTKCCLYYAKYQFLRFAIKTTVSATKILQLNQTSGSQIGILAVSFMSTTGIFFIGTKFFDHSPLKIHPDDENPKALHPTQSSFITTNPNNADSSTTSRVSNRTSHNIVEGIVTTTEMITSISALIS